ncbi:hypothetical protein ACEQ8H_000928 [Pleosporales sp. CAS-2024a]
MLPMLGSKDANRDPSGGGGGGGGRTSRASDMSALSRITGIDTAQPDGARDKHVPPPFPAGVQSMLRSSTEWGNLGGIRGDGVGDSSFGASQRRNAPSRMSTASSRSGNSMALHRQHHPRPPSSNATRQGVRDSNLSAYNASSFAMDTRYPLVVPNGPPNPVGVQAHSPMVDEPLYAVAREPRPGMPPGSSSFVPHPERQDRDAHRSFSMTNSWVTSRPYPVLQAANSRSAGNLRTANNSVPHAHPPGGGPRERHMHPAQLAASQGYQSNLRYGQPPLSQDHRNLPSQTRTRTPSDANPGHSDRGHDAARYPRRSTSLGYSATPGKDNVPPMPAVDPRYRQHVSPIALHVRAPVHHKRMRRSIKGSASSGSSSMPTDSDTPSGMGTPATSRGGRHMNLVPRPPGIRMTAPKTEQGERYYPPSTVEWYDGSEQFEDVPYVPPEPQLISNHPAVQSEIAIHEEDHNDGSNKVQTVLTVEEAPPIRTEALEPTGIAELPASPVGPRITREFVQQEIGAPSTTDEIGSPTRSSKHLGITKTVYGQATPQSDTGDVPGSAEPSTDTDDTQVSNAPSSEPRLVDSSTIDFAVRYSIPAIAGQDHKNNHVPDRAPVPVSPEKSTNSGMSDLLAGYQHTDTKLEDRSTFQANGIQKQDTMATDDDAAARVINHAQQPSDEQSFKSCTNASHELTSDLADNKSTVQTARSNPQLTAESPDMRSVQRRNDNADVPNTNSEPSLRLPSSNLEAEMQPKRLAAASASPFRQILRTFGRGRNESNVFSSSKSLEIPKSDVKQGPNAASASSSTLSTSQLPAVPPRDSSASTEAQRLSAVGTFLLRKGLFPKSKSSVSRLDIAVANGTGPTTADHVEQQSGSLVSLEVMPPPREPAAAAVVATNQTPIKEDVAPQAQRVNDPVELRNANKDLRVGLTLVPAVQHHSFNGPIPGIPGSSSFYSLHDISFKGRTNSSPAKMTLSLEENRRDSQSTTHLSWAGRKPLNNTYGATVSEPRLALPSVQEDTTTDLRLSMYKYNAPQRYLHDVKEDSHEDSSLNTSASNLKNSHFRFPPSAAGLGMRASIDDVVGSRAKSSAGSRRASVMIEDMNGLPLLEFSEANLYDKFKSALPDDVRFSRSSARAHPATELVVHHHKARDSVNGVNQDRSLRESVRSLGVIDFGKLKRRYSSEQLIAEIDRVSIPSITALTQRVGEMFPSLALVSYRDATDSSGGVVEFPEEEEIMQHAMDEIHHVHPPSQKRSSARLRPVRGSSALMVVDDDLFEEMTSRERGCGDFGDQCMGPLEFEVEVGAICPRAKGKGKITTHTTPTRPLSTVDELCPSPHSHSNPHPEPATAQTARTSVELVLSSLARSSSSLASTPTTTETRPWNSDKNYPWATKTNPSFDISLPPQLALKQSPRPGPSHLRNALSDATSSTFTSVHTPTSPSHPTGPSNKAGRQSHHRISIFGRNGDQAHAAGERYPTSALSPPTAIFRDHLSTCDTSDDEDFTVSRKSNRLTLRKRFSSATRSNTATHITPRAARSKVNSAELASPAPEHEQSSSTLQDRIGEARAFTSNRHTFRDAQGMPTGAYHRARIVESIKRWWHKGGDLIRTLSRRNDRRQHDYSWEIFFINYESAMEFSTVKVVEYGPPPVPPNTPVSSPPPSPPPPTPSQAPP